ncbi:DUF1501 domain-containing protein [Cryptosporangium sp. NPDC051539]|uniref:DUF1501 domain-containing protein n=1 Tax=Cryptosporangium sp. NPDC051539 TaxID=3363962 RepID=UPI0037AF07D9
MKFGDAVLRAEAAAVQSENAAVRDEWRSLNEAEEAAEDGRGVTRRTVLLGAGLGATTLLTSQFLNVRASFGASGTGTLIHVFLFGGLDGLSLVAPANDPVLAAARPGLVLPTGGSIALARGFALNRAFEPLKKYLDAGELGFVPGVSDPRLSRSHFQCQDACELGGLPSETQGRGWMDVLTSRLGPGTAFRSVGVGSTLRRSLVGTQGALALRNLPALAINGDAAFAPRTAEAIKTMFTGLDHPAAESVEAAVGALALASRISSVAYTPANGAVYPAGLGDGFKTLAQLIKGGANVRTAAVSMGGFDTHSNQGTNGGHLFTLFGQMASALRAFFDDLGDARKNVTVVLSSEFGRRVAQNGSGTDHGHGNVVTVLSGQKLSSSLLGTWPGLGTLDNGDVPEFNNMFDVFGTVAQSRFGLSATDVAAMFPKRTFKPITMFA